MIIINNEFGYGVSYLSTEEEKVLFLLAAYNLYRAWYSEDMPDKMIEPENVVKQTEAKSGFYLQDEDKKSILEKLKYQIADKG